MNFSVRLSPSSRSFTFRLLVLVGEALMFSVLLGDLGDSRGRRSFPYGTNLALIRLPFKPVLFLDLHAR